nr:RNA-directed DNA polymerase, eukaryota [Tanacetum cinerariifolium]
WKNNNNNRYINILLEHSTTNNNVLKKKNNKPKSQLWKNVSATPMRPNYRPLESIGEGKNEIAMSMEKLQIDKSSSGALRFKKKPAPKRSPSTDGDSSVTSPKNVLLIIILSANQDACRVPLHTTSYVSGFLRKADSPAVLATSVWKKEVGISTRWVKSVPSKVNITAWKIKTNALPMRFNLSRREIDIDTLMCPVCKGGVETTSLLFFQCVLSKQIMRKVSSWWNVDYTDKGLFPLSCSQRKYPPVYMT